MSRVLALTRRELSAYFFAPVPYFVLFFFLLLMSYFFMVGTVRTGGGDIAAFVSFSNVFQQLSFILIFLIPMLTMNTVAEEKARNTIETLLTAPVADWQVILSKWLGTFFFYCLMLVPTLVFLLILRSYGESIGKPDIGSVISTYTGALFIGGLYIAIGVFASSVTENALLSAFVAFFTMIFLLAIQAFTQFTGDVPTWLRNGSEYLSQQSHFEQFLNGRIALHDVIYFVTATLLFLFGAVRALESRKWR